MRHSSKKRSRKKNKVWPASDSSPTSTLDPESERGEKDESTAYTAPVKNVMKQAAESGDREASAKSVAEEVDFFDEDAADDISAKESTEKGQDTSRWSMAYLLSCCGSFECCGYKDELDGGDSADTSSGDSLFSRVSSVIKRW